METRKYKFKVVKKRNNRSCIINGNSKYSLVYEKDTAVYAPIGTLGVMVFKTKTQAEEWLIGWNTDALIIKRVIPIGRGKTPHEISDYLSTSDLKEFYSGFRRYNSTDPVPGTICYSGVFVID